MDAVRTPHAVVILLTAAAALLLLLPAGAHAAGTSWWSVDLLVAYHAGRPDSAAPAKWATNGGVAWWELDVDQGGVTVEWVQADGNFGAYEYLSRAVADGNPHRIHMEARQAGPDIDLTLTVSGLVVQPITVPSQQIGPITLLAQSPATPLRHATFAASVADVTGWSG